MKLNFSKFCLTLMLVLTSFLSVAQPIDPPADGDPPAAPIDTKLIWLAVIGLVFMVYYFKRPKQIQ
mgnify:CR=1 FL=1